LQRWDFFSKFMDLWLSHSYIYGYCKIIVNESKNINSLHTCCLINPPYVWLFSHMTNQWLDIKNLTNNLHFLSLFNYNHLLFFMFFYYTLRICSYTKKKSIESCCAWVNIARVGMFSQNTQIKSYHISMSMATIK